jgi:hypothetical protein
VFRRPSLLKLYSPRAKWPWGFRLKGQQETATELPQRSILRQLGHLIIEDPPLSVPFSRKVWLYRESKTTVEVNFTAKVILSQYNQGLILDWF